MDLSAPISALSDVEHERLARLLAVLPIARGWSVRHMHGPLLSALGLLNVGDAAYAEAAHRRFADPGYLRRRALALLDELEREAREERYRQHRAGARRP